MFTGIIETIGVVRSIRKEEENVRLTIEADFATELKVDQSVAHNGVCLTVVEIVNNTYGVVAIQETLDKSNLGGLSVGDPVNLERGMRLGDRLDGHIVQGHVDQTGKCVSVEEQNGSWIFTFEYDPSQSNVTIEKGSITINGVSLTVVDSKKGGFSVAIIPYTYEHTTFHELSPGATVNLEFDVIGKYVQRITSLG
jgi:riboflavin synthase